MGRREETGHKPASNRELLLLPVSLTHHQLPAQYKGSSFLECVVAIVRGHPLLSSRPVTSGGDVSVAAARDADRRVKVGREGCSWKVWKVNTRKEKSHLNGGTEQSSRDSGKMTLSF